MPRLSRALPCLLLALGLLACQGGDTEAPPDAEPGVDATGDSVCVSCGADEICVQRFDGTCTQTLLDCVPTKVDCPDNACSEACEAALCGGEPYQCENRPPCGTEVTDAFTCYGP